MTINNPTPIGEAIRLTRIWQDHGPNTYPLDINQLIAGMFQPGSFDSSLKVKYKNLTSIEGCLVRTPNTNDWTIALSSNAANLRRQRFTYAHELGHFMCHRKLRNEFNDNQDSLNNFFDPIENEANIFASWLLMPANLVRNEFSQCSWDVKNLRKMGVRFEASLQASALRYVDVCEKPVAFVVSRDGMIVWSRKSSNAPFMTAYQNGDELPEGSIAKSLSKNSLECGVVQKCGRAWSPICGATESNHFDTSYLEFQYTCITFTG